VRTDNDILSNAGISYGQIASVFEYLFDHSNWEDVDNAGSTYSGKLKGKFFQRMCLEEPRGFKYDGKEIEFKDILLICDEKGNKVPNPEIEGTYIPGCFPDMLRDDNFFGGNTFWGIKPNWAIEIYNWFSQHISPNDILAKK